ncbi:hypothetical protein GC176_17395 [bacterium]|nr:hypothetical protein [bacterium]
MDQHGLLHAADSPYYFFWIGRKGFILHDGDQSIARLLDYHCDGARYVVAERAHLDSVPSLESELRQKYEGLDERGDTMLIDLGSPTAQPSESSRGSATFPSQPSTRR